MGLGILKLLSFEKTFVSVQAFLRHNEYSKANYKKSYVTCKKTFECSL